MHDLVHVFLWSTTFYFLSSVWKNVDNDQYPNWTLNLLELDRAKEIREMLSTQP